MIHKALKPLKARKCKFCKVEYTPKRPFQPLCSPKCKSDYEIENKVKVAKKFLTGLRRERLAQKKADKEKLETVASWHKRAKKVFNLYIRLRDRGHPCISCGTQRPVQYCAGHYRTVGAAGHLRYNEDNVHLQCNRYCNKGLSGNIINYTPNLILKIGRRRVNALTSNNDIRHWTIEELKGIVSIYKAKIKEEKRKL